MLLANNSRGAATVSAMSVREVGAQAPLGWPNPGCGRPHRIPTSPGSQRRSPQESHGRNGIIRYTAA
jgi:hypothetical protein